MWVMGLNSWLGSSVGRAIHYYLESFSLSRAFFPIPITNIFIVANRNYVAKGRDISKTPLAKYRKLFVGHIINCNCLFSSLLYILYFISRLKILVM